MRSIIFSTSRLLIICTSILTLCARVPAQRIDSLLQQGFERAVMPLAPHDTLVKLPHEFIVPNSEIVDLDTVRLKSGADYLLEPRSGKVFLQRALSRDSAAAHVLTIFYRRFPFILKESYRHREPAALPDTLTGRSAQAARPSSSFSIDDLFGSNVQKSGSIVRGFTMGSNRDLSLTSGFRMQMSGNLTNDIQVIAALTDENSPIQPEGTTKTLQEIDKVFVELRGSNMAATLGDFSLDMARSEFGRMTRKLQGAKGDVSFGDRKSGGEALLAGASTRGKFATNQFQGADGVQGPYRLSGRNNERAIIVVAGTEKVYVNGERMVRGEVGDYVIDYASAEITFSYRRVIFSASRIVVDFEYSDRQYPRNLIAGRAGATLFGDRLSFAATLIREGDDESSPIDESLSDADKDTLRAAGADRSKAKRSGAVYAGPGKGQYLLIDTLIIAPSSPDTIHTSFYRFATDSADRAPYTVTFSYTGPANGDYDKVTLSQYRFVGLNNGSYAPVRFLPLPQSTSLADIDLSAALTDDVTLSGEYAHSGFDANKFSPASREDGSALKFGFRVAPKRLRLGGLDLGSADLRFRERIVGASFVPLDRFNDVEFSRQWNLNESTKANEELHEGSIAYRPSESLTLGGTMGSLSRGDEFSSARYTGNVGYHAERLPDVGYMFELIRSSNAPADQSSTWIRHHALIQDTLGLFASALKYDGEVLWSKSLSLDTLRRGTFRYHEITPSVTIADAGRMSFGAVVGWRWDDSLKSGIVQRVSTTLSQEYHWALREWHTLTSSLDVAIRNRAFTPAFRQGDNDRIQTVLLRSQTRFNPFDRAIESDWFYEAASERAARLERVFQRVTKGTGNYVYAGDLNNNHLADPEEFQLSRFDGDFIAVTLPTDELIPVVDVKASTRFRLNGSRIARGSSWLEKAASLFSTETYIRIEEKSGEPETRHIYLLYFSRFLDERTTLLGSHLFTQDIHLRENDPQFSMRFRYVQRKGMTQFALQNEKTYTREQSGRLRWQLVKEIANQIDVVHKTDDLSSTLFSNRVRSIASTSVSTDWSYRFQRHIELGFAFGFGHATNFDSTAADLNDQRARITYAIAERAQAKAELTREEVVVGSSLSLLPFELTGGKVPGQSWRWQIGLEYRISQFVQASLNYDGRNEGRQETIHTARASVRAFF